MTPTQCKVLKALTADNPKSRQDLIFKTKLNYHAIHKALVYLMETGQATSICIDKVTHYVLKPQEVLPLETTVARAIRLRPALHTIWAN